MCVVPYHGGKPRAPWQLRQKELCTFSIDCLNMYMVGCDKALILFDHMVTPIVTYGAEIWGFEYNKTIEEVQIQLCKRLLGVKMSGN
jgi:hypothetical protein